MKSLLNYIMKSSILMKKKEEMSLILFFWMLSNFKKISLFFSQSSELWPNEPVHTDSDPQLFLTFINFMFFLMKFDV